MTRMMTEILEQPDAVRRTLVQVASQRGELRRLAVNRRIVLFVARGSSNNAAQYGRYLLGSCSEYIPLMTAPSALIDNRPTPDHRDVLLIALSQSGETGEINRCVQQARRRGAATVGVTNNPGSELARAVDLALFTQAGVEKAIPPPRPTPPSSR